MNQHKMKNHNLYLLSIIIILFFGINVLGHFGIYVEHNSSQSWQKILPAAYISLYLFVISLIQNGYNSKCKEERNLLIIFIIMIISIYIRNSLGYIGIINCYIYPVVISYLTYTYSNKRINIQFTKKVKSIILFFFIVECSLAILERIVGINIFPFTGIGSNTLYDHFYNIDSEFRSTSLQNHPLQNALCITVILAYILCSNFNIKAKILFFLLGYTALLCFNTRSSIIAWGVLFIVYFFKEFKSLKNRQRVTLLLFVVLGCLVLAALILNSGFGDRLLAMGIYDENSASQRVTVFNIFNKYSLKEFIFGVNREDIQKMLDYVNVGILENYWLSILFSHGIIILIAITILYYKLFKRLFKRYSTFNKVFIIGSFILISSTNNSLVTPGAYMVLFILCSYIFQEEKIYKNKS